MTESLDLGNMHEGDREILRGIAARMRKLYEMKLPPILPPPTKTTRETSRDRLRMVVELDGLDAISRYRSLTDPESHRMEYLIKETTRKEPRP